MPRSRVRDKSFVIVDTGGFEPDTDDAILAQMRTQTLVAIEQADIIVFLGDGKTGAIPSDREIVRLLQKAEKKIFYAVNKIDSEKQEDFAADFYQLGVDPIFPVSAMTGYGMGELIDALLDEIPEEAHGPETPELARSAYQSGSCRSTECRKIHARQSALGRRTTCGARKTGHYTRFH